MDGVATVDRWGGGTGRIRDPHEPWRRAQHRGRPGAVVAAGLFHVLGAHSQAAESAVYRPMDLLAYAILLVGPVALWWRRAAPIGVLAVAAAASITFATFAAPAWMYAVAPVIALFSAV